VKHFGDVEKAWTESKHVVVVNGVAKKFTYKLLCEHAKSTYVEVPERFPDEKAGIQLIGRLRKERLHPVDPCASCLLKAAKKGATAAAVVGHKQQRLHNNNACDVDSPWCCAGSDST